MGSIALFVFTGKGNFEGCGTQPLVLHVAEFKREAFFQSNLKLVSLPSNSASEFEEEVSGRSKVLARLPRTGHRHSSRIHAIHQSHL